MPTHSENTRIQLFLKTQTWGRDMETGRDRQADLHLSRKLTTTSLSHFVYKNIMIGKIIRRIQEIQALTGSKCH